MKLRFFSFSFFLIVAYEFAFKTLGIDGFSLLKIAYTLLPWLLLVLTVIYLQKNYALVKKRFSRVIIVLFATLILWNLIIVIRSLIFDSGKVYTIFGNEGGALALLTPLVAGYSMSEINLRSFNSFIFRYLLIVTIVSPILLIISNLPNWEIPVSGCLAFLIPVNFLITTSYLNKYRDKFILIVAVVLYCYVAWFYLENRTSLLRIALLILVLISSYFIKLYRADFFSRFYMLILAIPFIALLMSFLTGESIITQILNNFSNVPVGPDSRSFLYIEVFRDLSSGYRDLIFGRGITGTYYSSYFANVEYADAANRISVEVGFLWLLLKGGVVSLFLYLSIFLITIHKAFYDSKNKYIKAVGWMLVIHVILLFIQNEVNMDIYNFLVWVFIGVVLNKKIRYLTDTEVNITLFS